MKTPRELLFWRHRSAESKLDAIRQQTVAAVCDRHRSERIETSAVMDRRYNLREILLSLRWHLAGMSAAWLLVAILNMDHAPNQTTAAAKRNVPSPRQLLIALIENRRELLQLIEQPAVEPASLPPRRSEFQSPQAMV